MKKSPIFWVAKQVRRRVPGIALMTATQVINALLSVYFALGTRGGH